MRNATILIPPTPGGRSEVLSFKPWHRCVAQIIRARDIRDRVVLREVGS